MIKALKSPNFLAFDTSSSACSVALSCGEKVISFHKVAPRQQTHLILSAIRSLLDSCSMELSQLDAIAYGCGPGSFTGIRLACSVAQGLGFALSMPLIPISSLAILAQTAYQIHGFTRVFTLVDARMQQVHGAAFEISENKYMKLKEPEQRAISPEALILPIDAGWYGVGDGWLPYGERLQKRLSYPLQAMCADELPRADAMLPLARLKYEKGEWVRPEEAQPVYS